MFFDQVTIKRTIPIEAYRPYDQTGLDLGSLIEKGRAVSRALGPAKVWMLSSTESGGGVAELMPRLCALLGDLGVDARWLVLRPGDPRFFRATKSLHNMLHGEAGTVSSDELANVYDAVCREAAPELRTIVNRADVLIVHDPQPMGVARYLPREHLPKLLWRCHVGVPSRNETTASAWRFLDPYLQCYRRLLFSNELYIPDELFDRSGVLLPGIDPLNHKNRELTPYKMIGILRSAGLAQGPEQGCWAQFVARAQHFEGGSWVEQPIPDLLYQPVVLQISRFDRLKGFDRLLAGFVQLLHTYPDRVPAMRVHTERAMDELSRVQLILAGPVAEGVQDDPEAAATLELLTEQARQLEPADAARIHLLRLPMQSVRQNALTVNALQRIATVIAQCSTKEGFGLTVTEAMWKGVPIIASGVGGIALQVRPGTDGLLLHDRGGPAEIADALLRALVFPREAEARARAAQARVRSHFLVTTELCSWLDELGRLLESPASGASPG